MSLWYLNILGMCIEVVNHQKKNIVLNMDLEILWNDSGTVLLGKYL